MNRGGGRGGGRGWRGRGRGGPQAMARDDDGTVLAPAKPEGPPPLFPPIDTLPELPEVTPQLEQLLSKKRALESAWRYSPYYIEKPKGKAVGVAAEIERYSDKYKRHPHANKAPLSSVLKLSSKHFPAELLGAERKGKPNEGPGGAAPWASQTGGHLTKKLDMLVEKEKRAAAMADKQPADKGKGEGEEEKKEGEEGEGEEELVEDEEELGEDDYAMNYGYDDDEGYDDDDGGDDEGPVF